MSEVQTIPDDVLATWAQNCRCCPVCWMSPCEACAAGGVCDAIPCRCDDESEYDDGYDDGHDEEWP